MSSTGHLARRLVPLLALAGGLLAAPAGPASATFPGGDGRIAFWDFQTGQVYSVRPDGSGQVQLSHVSAGHTAAHPDWSPDGSQVSFDSDQNGEIRLYVANADGSHLRRIAGDAAGYRDFQPRFLPGGTGFVFSRCKPGDGVCAIWSVRADGTGLRPLTSFKVGAEEAVDFAPAVAPDGGHIAFARFGAGGITAQVYVMRADGTGAHAITPAWLEGFAPSWSPDGRLITFSSDCCKLGSEVYAARPDGSGLTRLTDSPFLHNNATSAYSPRGTRVAFVSDRRYDDLCCLDLFVMNADGSGQHLVPTGKHGVLDPAWRPVG